MPTTRLGKRKKTAPAAAADQNKSGKKETKPTSEQWYQTLRAYEAVVDTGVSQKEFLESNLTADVFTGSPVQLRTFARYLENPTKERWATVTKMALTLCCCLAMTCGVGGFIGFVEKTQGTSTQ